MKHFDIHVIFIEIIKEGKDEKNYGKICRLVY